MQGFSAEWMYLHFNRDMLEGILLPKDNEMRSQRPQTAGGGQTSREGQRDHGLLNQAKSSSNPGSESLAWQLWRGQCASSEELTYHIWGTPRTSLGLHFLVWKGIVVSPL